MIGLLKFFLILFTNLYSGMATHQTREEIEKRRNREKWDKVIAVWDAQREVKVPHARKVTTVELDTAFHGIDWEPKYQGRGKGNAVRQYIHIHNHKLNIHIHCT